MLMSLKSRIMKFGKNEDGLGMLEIILIIAVLVVVAVVFKKNLAAIIEKLLTSASTKSDTFIKNDSPDK